MYRIKGSDQKEYGPIPLEQVRQWIAENRLNRHTLASTDSNPAWRPLSQFPELADLLATQPTAIANALPEIPKPPVAPSLPPPSVPESTIGAAIPSKAAENQVTGPAIALMVLGCIGILYCLISIPRMVLTDWSQYPIPAGVPPEMQGQFKAVINWFALYGKTYGIVFYTIVAILHGFVVYGGFKMKRLENLTLCWIATILAIPTYGCCCCLSIPVSIWCMVTLTRPEVRSRFR